MAKATHKFFLFTSLLATATMPLPALAQPTLQSAAPRGREIIRIPCCRCLNGARHTVAIDTGSARWQVAGPGSAAFQPVAAAANVSWTPLPPATWVGPPGTHQLGDYTYRLQFRVPRCTIPPRITISGRFGADNTGRLMLDGVPVASSQGTANYGFLPGSITPFSVTVTPNSNGLHVLNMVVTNSSGPTGVAIQGTITIICPRNLEVSDRADGPLQVQEEAIEPRETGDPEMR